MSGCGAGCGSVQRRVEIGSQASPGAIAIHYGWWTVSHLSVFSLSRAPHPLGSMWAIGGGLLGFFVAGYTGVLLSVTNRPCGRTPASWAWCSCCPGPPRPPPSLSPAAAGG